MSFTEGLNIFLKRLKKNRNGNIKEIIQISWPISMGMLSFTVMDFSDALIIGQLGAIELASIGLSSSIVFFINSFFIGFFESIKIAVSQKIGANQPCAAKQIGRHGLLISIPVGMLIICLGFMALHLFKWIGGSMQIQEKSMAYFSLRIWASPFWLITVVLSNYYQGIGNTYLPMKINIFMCVINVLLNQILIFGFYSFPAYGIYGSAYATIIANVFGMIFILVCFIKDTKFEFKPHIRIIKQIFKFGLPIGIRWLLDVGGWTFAIVLVAQFGDKILAANQIAIRIMSLSLLPIYGISEAACILTAKYFGAGNLSAVQKTYWSAIKISLILTTATGLMFILLPIKLASLFQRNDVILFKTKEILFLMSIYQITAAFSIVTAGALNGIGETRFITILNIISTWFIMVPGAYILSVNCNLNAIGVWISLIIHETVLVIGTRWKFKIENWKNFPI